MMSCFRAIYKSHTLEGWGYSDEACLRRLLDRSVLVVANRTQLQTH